MQVVSSINELDKAEFQRISIACGNFDGLHLGHQKIIDRLLKFSSISNSVPVVLTFTPHPRYVLTGKRFPLLASMKTKVRLLERLGVKAVINVDFTKAFASQSAESFVEIVLQSAGIEVCDICVGSDWRFGAGREGSVEFLKNGKWGFKIQAVEELQDSIQTISSSRIREALLQNDFQKAAQMLGRDYSISGDVVKGAGIATSELKFPTANVSAQQLCLPLAGVFACEVTIDEKEELIPAVCNIGSAPTFGESEKVKVEVHLIDFDGNLYGKEVEVFFKDFIRLEKKFSSIDELKEQISEDVATARKILID